MPATTPLPGEGSGPATRYEVCVEGVVDEGWSAWFEGLEISNDGRVTAIAGEVADQAALRGLLAKVHDLGLALISLRRIDSQ